MDSLYPKTMTFDFAANHTKAQHSIRFNPPPCGLCGTTCDRLHGRGAGERGEVKNHSVTCDPAKFLQASSPIRCMHQHTQADGVIKNL